MSGHELCRVKLVGGIFQWDAKHNGLASRQQVSFARVCFEEAKPKVLAFRGFLDFTLNSKTDVLNPTTP